MNITSSRHQLRPLFARTLRASLGICCIAQIANAQTPTASTPTPTAPAEVATPTPKPLPFRLFRYDEDYLYWADPNRRTSFVDDLKYIALDKDELFILSFGGEARSRYEYISDPAFGLRGPGHDDFLIQRFLLHADLQIGKRDGLNARAFVQLLSGLVAGEELSKPGNQNNALDFQQAFGEISIGDTRAPASASDNTTFRLRAGRQEMGLGSYRLVTSREPTNARLSFDGVRTTLSSRAIVLDAFLVQPTDKKIGLFNDNRDDTTTFWGFYATLPIAPEKGLNVDVYYMGLNRDNTRFQSGVGDELRHSIGTRLWGRAHGWDHDTEAVVQFGSFDRPTASEDILAWTIASNTGYTFENAFWKPRIGLKLNYASGDDDPTDGDLNTFNPLFPRNNYFSDANLLAPYNFFDIHPTLTVKPSEDLTITAGWDAYFRASTKDAVFSPTGIVIPAAATNDRFVGSTLTLVADWNINRNLALTASYAHFFRGPAVKNAGGKDVDFFGVWLTAKF